MTSQFTSISFNFELQFWITFHVNLGQIITRYDFIWTDEWFWAMLEPTPTLSNFDFGQLFMWIVANNDQIWLPRGLKSDFEKCSNRLQLDLSSLLVNLLNVLGQILAIYDFLEAITVILAMFEPTPTWPNFYFGQRFIWIEANNDQICLPRGEISDLEQCSNRRQLDLI